MSEFFERMKEGFNRGVAAVSAGSKHVIEKTKLNMAIKNLEDEKKNLIEALGYRVYKFYTENKGLDIPNIEISEISGEILALDKQIKINKKKLEVLEEEMNQLKKGNSAIADDEIKCGCGYVNPAEARYCLKCGSELK